MNIHLEFQPRKTDQYYDERVALRCYQDSSLGTPVTHLFPKLDRSSAVNPHSIRWLVPVRLFGSQERRELFLRVFGHFPQLRKR